MSPLGEAIRADHQLCADRTCDIDVAAERGYEIAAAWLLLTVADECPHVVAVLKRDQIALPSDIRKHPQWAEWLKFATTYGRACAVCGTVTYGDELFEPDRCGGCLASLGPRP